MKCVDHVILSGVLYPFVVMGTCGSVVRSLFSLDKIALEVALKLPSK
jgi:hypothetical protein